MLEQCVTLIPRLDWIFLNELLVIALYFPWFSFVATWIVSIAFYDGEMFFTNVFVNYLLFSILYYISRMTGIVSPVIAPCDSFFFDIYRYIFPSATFIVTLAYYTLIVMHHRKKKEAWWTNQTLFSTILITFIIMALPLGYVTALWYYDIMGLDLIFCNIALVALLVVAVNEFSRHNYYWRHSIARLNIYMGWNK